MPEESRSVRVSEETRARVEAILAADPTPGATLETVVERAVTDLATKLGTSLTPVPGLTVRRHRLRFPFVLLVVGSQGDGKTELATDVLRAALVENPRLAARVYLSGTPARRAEDAQRYLREMSGVTEFEKLPEIERKRLVIGDEGLAFMGAHPNARNELSIYDEALDNGRPPSGRVMAAIALASPATVLIVPSNAEASRLLSHLRLVARAALQAEADAADMAMFKLRQKWRAEPAATRRYEVSLYVGDMRRGWASIEDRTQARPRRGA